MGVSSKAVMERAVMEAERGLQQKLRCLAHDDGMHEAPALL
jgi:hypothetical protein